MALNRYEDILPLNYTVDSSKAIQELEQLTEWKDGKTRKYVDLIGATDQGYTGKSGDTSLNNIADKLPTLTKFITEFPSVHKARVHRLDAGSFFEPHRDHFPGERRFRVLVPLNNTTLDAYAFIYDRQIYEFNPGVPYVLNTTKVHGSMSFKDGTYHMIMSVNNTDDNISTVMRLMSFR